MTELIGGYFGGQIEQKRTFFAPALSWYCPLVASQLELRAVSCSAAELGPPFYLLQRLFGCHQSRLPGHRMAWGGCFHRAWLQLPVEWTRLHSLLFSWPATQKQTLLSLGRCLMAYIRLKVKTFPDCDAPSSLLCWDIKAYYWKSLIKHPSTLKYFIISWGTNFVIKPKVPQILGWVFSEYTSSQIVLLFFMWADDLYAGCYSSYHMKCRYIREGNRLQWRYFQFSFTYCGNPFPTQMISTLGAGWRLVTGDIHKCTARI